MVKKILRRNKKLILLITVLILAFVAFLRLNNQAHSYEMDYTINNVKVEEKYDNKDKYYAFNIKYKDIDIELISLNRYSKSRHLITNILISNEDNNTCLKFVTKELNLYPICHNNEGYYSEYINKYSSMDENEVYGNIVIDDLDNHSYLLWNYNEFVYLKGTDRKNIKLFDKDVYNLSLIYQYNNYLIIPNYSQDWIFDNINVINGKSGKLVNYTLRFPVYFDSYFLGNIGNNVYIYDRKEEQEYYFDIKKEDIFKVGNKIYVDGKWENVTAQKLKNKKASFSNNKVFDYYIKDNQLYFTGDVKASNRSINSIVRVDGLDVFYLSDGVLYKYNPIDGEKALIKYSEWEFNTNNMIFIFN